MIARLYRMPGAEAPRRASEVLERFGLVEAAARRVSTYSGGMRRRLDLAAGLIGRSTSARRGNIRVHRSLASRMGSAVS
jgi:ABC-type multidrug transport system ATPase subunit